jgi:hypothetical protein
MRVYHHKGKKFGGGIDLAFNSAFITLNGRKLHFIDSLPVADPTLSPVLICPGLSERAEEYEDFIRQLLPRRGIVLSFRGRGNSDSPERGYDLVDHVQDIEAIVGHLNLERFHLFAHSRGVPYAMEYSYRHQEQPFSLILQDYPPEHKRMPPGWADNYIRNYLIPHQRTDNISEIAVRGIERESTQVQFTEVIRIPGLILRGMLEGSLIERDDLQRYRSIISDIQVVEFAKSGHDIRRSEEVKMIRDIQDFLAEVEQNL